MNLLPTDLKELIIVYFPYNKIKNYLDLINPSPGFYVRSLVHTTGLDPNLIMEIWNLPDLIPLPTLYDRYVRGLTYFNYVVPGSEVFLNLQECYIAASDNLDLPTTLYFGNKLGYSDKTVRYNFYKDMGEVRRFMIEPKAKFKHSEYFHQIVKGKVPDIPAKLLSDMFDPMVIAIIYNQYGVLEGMVERYNIPEKRVRDALLYANVITNNLKELKDLFPTIDKGNSALFWLKNYNLIDAKVLRWLISKEVKLPLANPRNFAIYYEVEPKKLFKELDYHHRNLYPLYHPLYAYLILKTEGPSQLLFCSLTAFLTIPDYKLDIRSKESINVIIYFFKKSDDPKLQHLAIQLQDHYFK